MEVLRFVAIFFLFATEIQGQYQQFTGCPPCVSQQPQSSGYSSNGLGSYQYDQKTRYGYQNPSSTSQSGSYATNNAYQSSPYSGNPQYNPGTYNNLQSQQYGATYSQGQQSGTMYNQGYQSQGYQSTGPQSTGSQSNNSSEPGYLRDYKGDMYTDPGRIQETQALNAPFFQSIGGEPQYQGAVDGPQGNNTQGSNNTRGKK